LSSFSISPHSNSAPHCSEFSLFWLCKQNSNARNRAQRTCPKNYWAPYKIWSPLLGSSSFQLTLNSAAQFSRSSPPRPPFRFLFSLAALPFFVFYLLSLSLSLALAHTHTHTH
jgi:hypothetical protein